LTTATVLAGVVQVGGGIALSPLVPGLTQTLKAFLQGRRGPTPLQPYRELRRLWHRSAVRPEGTTLVYALAPAVVAAALAAALIMLPIGGRSPGWPFGNDAIALVGLLALARFVYTLSAWDTGNGFSLMGAARDLSFSVFVEGLLLATLLLASVPAASTSLIALSDAGNGWAIWEKPLHWCALFAFGLVVVAETGRQPVDNPDTHLELTMLHEGPLLEYAGRDQAFVQWSVAARHWVLAVLAVELFLPHAGGAWWRLATLPAGIVAVCVALALTETWVAKMRILRVPRFLAAGAVLCVVGLASWFVGGGT
jgi:formate hydrogenlyase subunit 4